MKTIDSNNRGRGCGCRRVEAGASRRDFLGTTCSSFAALAVCCFDPGRATPFAVSLIHPQAYRETERSYPIPPADGISIDEESEVILVRHAGRVYAFALSCPHQNTPLRWRPREDRFFCTRHESRYQPDGTFVSGRATRHMDRYAIQRDGENVLVDLSKLYQSDQQGDEWAAAFITP